MKIALAILASVAVVGLGRPQTPVRDVPRLGTVGSATISGVVVADDDTHAALRRATVTLSRAGIEDMRTTLTDDQGRFAYRELPAGVYTLSAAKAGYVTASYGALQPGMPGTSISLTDAQRFPAKPLALLRGGVIAGRLLDRDGLPLPATVVLARAMVVVNGERRLRYDLRDAGNAATNVHGEYRIYGLPPGQYAVCADAQFSAAERRTNAAELAWARQPAGEIPPGRLFSYAPTCFPGTADPAGAVPIVLARGEERAGVEFAVQYAPVSRVTGVVVGADDKPAFGVTVWRGPRSPDATLPSISPSARTGPDGVFTFTNVPPGEYVLTSRGAPSSDATVSPNVRAGFTFTARSEWGTADLTVSGQDVTDARIRLQPGMSVAGRVMFQAASQATPDVTRVIVVLSADNPMSGVPSGSSTSVRPDGTFQLDGLMPGRFRLTRVGLPAGSWVVRSAMLGGQDLMDVPLDLRPGGDVSGIVVTLSERLAGLTGTLVDAAGRPTPQFYVFVFPVDRAYWTNSSRRVTSTRADVNGVYTIDGLPPGEYYVCALTELDRTQQYEPSYLEQLVPAALKIALGEGQTLAQRLRVGG